MHACKISLHRGRASHSYRFQGKDKSSAMFLFVGIQLAIQKQLYYMILLTPVSYQVTNMKALFAPTHL